METILFEFAGVPRTLGASDLRTRMMRAGAEEGGIPFYMNLLCDVNFLGIPTASGFVFAGDEGERAMLLAVAERLAVERGWPELTFEVNAAFHLASQIE